MEEIFATPQPITGSETVTIQQMQNGQLALCTMPLSSLIALIGESTSWSSGLPNALPETAGILWNNNGVICIS